MFIASITRWKRLPWAVTFLLALCAPLAAFAGNTHSEGGAVTEAPGVPEMDAQATVQIYWTGDTAARTSVVSGATLAGYWLHDVGFALTRQWLVGDAHVAFIEMQTGAGTAAHTGYYGISTKALTSLDPDEFPAMTVRAIPVPQATAGPGSVAMHWAPAQTAGTPSAIAGYDVYRSTDGIAFTKLNAATLADTTYLDTAVVFGTTYQYAVGLVYGGTPPFAGTALSANSAPVTPLDATPPDAPEFAAETPFTQGTSNQISWSDESASGATAYFAEAALDGAFTSLVGNSGWIATTNHTFSDLADGRTYFYRVRSRDVANNMSPFAAAVSSRQDASAPASYALALAAFKAVATIDIEFAATDSLSGVNGVDLYWSKDGGAYTAYPGGPFTTSPIAFDASTTGGDGTYAFYTLAADNVANAEAAPEAPDATTVMDTQAPAAPALAALPSFSAGTARLVAWDAAAEAAAYRVQAATDAAFSTIAHTSDWITTLDHTFTGLTDAGTYHYRVQSRDAAGNESVFSDILASTQDATAPETAVAALPTVSGSTELDIAWSGSDATSGLAGVALYYRRNGGAPTLYPGGPHTASPIAFDAATTGGDGVYGFYTAGTDLVGNSEIEPASPDAEIVIDTAAPDAPAIAALPQWSAGTNRAVTWSGAGTSFLAQAATDAGFTAIAAESGWIGATSFTFTGLTDATLYHYRVRSRDAAGNQSAYSSLASSTQDAAAPVTAAAALPPTSSITAFDIAWSGNDAGSGLTGVQLYYSKDGGSDLPYPGGPFTVSPIAFDAQNTGGDGVYAFHTRGIDAVGNIESEPASPDAQIVIDTAAPGAPAIANITTFSPGNQLAIDWSDESASGAAQYRAEMSPDATFAVIEATSDWIAERQFTFTGLADGQEYAFRVQARDAAFNETGWSGVKSTTMDAAAPASQLEALSPLGNAPLMSLAWTGNDATSGIAHVDLYWSKDGAPYQMAGSFEASPIAFDASAHGDGAYAFYIIARDHVGNAEAAPATADATTMLDTTAPAVPALAALPGFSAGTERAIAWDDQSASGAVQYRAQASTQPAFTSIAFETAWANQLAHTFVGLADGQTYHYRVQARDAAGNASAFATAMASTQDATPPATQVAALPATSASSMLSLDWNGSDAASGLQNVDLWVSKDGGAFELAAAGPFVSSPIAFDTSALGDGTFAFYTRGRDAVGNLEPAPAAADAQTTIDTAAPGVPVLAAMPGFTAGTTVNLAWAAVDGAAAYRAQMSQSPSFATIGLDTGWIAANSFAFAGLQDGNAYSFRVQSRDAAANASAFSTVATTVPDAAAPSSNLAALPALVNAPALQLAWTGIDMTSGVAGVDLYYSRDGAAFAPYAGGPFTTSPIGFVSAQTGGDGQYAFYVRARDVAGNIEPAPGAPDAQTRIDTTAPSTPTIAALPQWSAGTSVLLNWNNQSATGAVEYQAEMATSADFTALIAQSGWVAATSHNFQALDDGATYWFRVKSRDAALNESAAAASQSTTLDDTSPASTVSALAPVTTTLVFPIAWTGSDATSGVASVDLYYARDGGAYTLYAGGPWTSSPIAFDVAATGGQGSYAFYTRARDRVANREPAPAGPDAQTIVNTSAVASPTLAALPNYSPGSTRTLSWTPGTNNAAFFAQASTSSTFASIHAETGWIGSTAFTFTGLADGTRYYYRVKARNTFAIESVYSLIGSSAQDATAPASQAAALTATQSTASFPIDWIAGDATSGIAGVDLYVSRNGGAFAVYPGGPFTQTPIAFDATALGGDGQYAFYTRAIDGVGNIEAAPASADAQTTIDSTAPAAPALLAEPSVTPGFTNTVYWNAMAGAANYQAECATDDAFANVIATSAWGAATSHTFTGLTDGVTYWYRVRARDAALNTSAWSASVSSTQSAGYVLAPGWNLISFNVDPTDTRIDRVLQSIQGSYSIVRTYNQGAFASYLPTLPVDFNDLQRMDAAHGYWIYMTRPDTLAVSGSPTDPAAPIQLGTGWNLAGYLPVQPMSPTVALNSIHGSYSLARGYEPGVGYHTYYPSLPALSDLVEMSPGQGYWLYMTEPDELVYGGLPKAEAAERAPAGMPFATQSDAASVPTVMDVWSTQFTIDGKPAAAGTVLEVYDGAGTLCATATVRSEGTLGIVHVTGDISVTDADEGATEGETLVLRIRGQDVTWSGGADLGWKALDARALALEFVSTESLLPKAFSLAQNSPNPFNPSTTIAYAIPARVDGERIAAARVELRIFDVRGRTVRTLVSAAQEPGRYTVVWNGRDDNGIGVGAGVYFYRLQTPEFTQARKMLLVK
jgi:hypothetical protein